MDIDRGRWPRTVKLAVSYTPFNSNTFLLKKFGAIFV
jgi:hypothetical protein